MLLCSIIQLYYDINCSYIMLQSYMAPLTMLCLKTKMINTQLGNYVNPISQLCRKPILVVMLQPKYDFDPTTLEAYLGRPEYV